MLTPKDHIGLIIELAQDRRVFKEMNHIAENRASITCELPLAKVNFLNISCFLSQIVMCLSNFVFVFQLLLPIVGQGH